MVYTQYTVNTIQTLMPIYMQCKLLCVMYKVPILYSIYVLTLYVHFMMRVQAESLLCKQDLNVLNITYAQYNMSALHYI